MHKTLEIGLLLCMGCLSVARAAPPLEAYGALPGIELVTLSPAGEQFALYVQVGDTPEVAVLARDGRALFAVKTGKAKVRSLRFAGENHLLVTLSTTYKAPLYFDQNYELDTVLNIDLQAKKVEPIFHSKPSVANAVFGNYGVRQVNGHLFGYFGGITYERTGDGDYRFGHGYWDLYRVDLESANVEIAARGSETPRYWVIAPDGSVLSHSEYNEQSGAWHLFEGGNGGRRLLDRVAPLREIKLIGSGRDAGTVLIEDSTGIQDVVAEVSLSDGKTEPLFGELTTEEYLFDRESDHLIGATIWEEPRAQFFDRVLQARFKATLKAFPGRVVSLESYNRGFGRLIVKTDGGRDSGTYYLVDIASGSASPIGEVYPSIHEGDVGETRTFHYTAADGLAIEAILTLPPGKEPKGLPLVLLPHGGPIGVSDKIGFDWWAQAYASRGYAVLQPNYRGSSGYGRAFRQAAFGQWGRKMQSDLSDGVAALARQGVIDEKRACIVGASYGGYAALAGVTLQQGLYRCAVSVAGPADLRSFFRWQQQRHGDHTAVTRYWRGVVGADQEGDSVMATLSPTLAATKADAPILLIHGKDDTVVPLEQSESMAAALKRAKKPYEMLVLTGEDHWLSQSETRVAMLKAAVAFVEKYNPAEWH
jgi:dienelactone hydrolase